MQLHSSILAHAHAPYPVLVPKHMYTLLIPGKKSEELANGRALIFLNIHLMTGQCADLSPYYS